MRIGVDESALSHVAGATDRAASVVAAIRLDNLAAAVSLAMPGSRSADVALAVVEAVGESARGLVRDLVQHAEALGTASLQYGDTEDSIAVEARRTAGAA
ncbi:MAG: hypothetical protein ABJA74_08005 [Lapillicoccus sp.]